VDVPVALVALEQACVKRDVGNEANQVVVGSASQAQRSSRPSARLLASIYENA
jgi:hypothetical protein